MLKWLRSVLPEKINKIAPPDLKFFSMLSVSFAFAFMVFIYSPFDIYLNNPSGFVVSWKFLLPPLTVAFFLCFLLLLVVLLLLWHRKIITGLILFAVPGLLIIIARYIYLMFSESFGFMIAAIIIIMVIWVLLIAVFKEKSADIVMLLMWGVIAASYVQTLFLNGKMVEITGQQTLYSERAAGNYINLLIWVTLTLTPLFVYMILKVKKRIFKYEKALVFSVMIISGMQIAGLTAAAVSTDLPEGFDDNPMYYSYEAAVTFNPDENIIVFVLDSLDVRVVRYTFDLYPHLTGYLDGFTLYENNTAEHFNTIPSMVSLITQHHIGYGMDDWVYREEAWEKHNFIDTLRENGFSTNLYLDQATTFERYDFIKHRTDNLKETDKLSINHRFFFPTILRLSLGRLSPYLLKNTLLAEITPSFGRNFYTAGADNEINSFIPFVGIESDIAFHRFLLQSEFSTGSEKSVFIMMHLNSVHADGDINDPRSYGYHYDEESGEIRHGGSRWDISRAGFEMLNLYFGKMKEIGIYDNSTIIITGDHGRRGDSLPETTALFIKPKNPAGALVTDTTTGLSHKYFAASIIDIAGLPHYEFGISYFDIINGLIPAPPRFLFVTGLWAPEMARIQGGHGVWEVTGDANDFDNWTFISFD